MKRFNLSIAGQDGTSFEAKNLHTALPIAREYLKDKTFLFASLITEVRFTYVTLIFRNQKFMFAKTEDKLLKRIDRRRLTPKQIFSLFGHVRVIWQGEEEIKLECYGTFKKRKLLAVARWFAGKEEIIYSC